MKKSLMEDKKNSGAQTAEALHLSEPQKAHLTGGFVICGVKLWLYDASFGI